MNTAVTITLIICGTIVLLSVITTIGAAIAAKKTSNAMKKMSEDFFKEDGND